MEHKELKAMHELNHEISRLKYLAMGIGPGRRDGQDLRDKLVKTRQRCWEICRRARDEIVPALLRQHRLQLVAADEPECLSMHDEIVPQTILPSAKDTANLNIVVCTLELLTRELRRLHQLVTSFPLNPGVRQVEFPDKLTPVDTLVRLTSTGCMISPAMAQIAAQEIIRAEREMEVARIARDRQEVMEIMYSLGYAKWAESRDKENTVAECSKKESENELINQISVRYSRTVVPICCVLYCACKKTYI